MTAELLNALIEKVVVHEAIRDTAGKRTQEIEIFYRFVGKILVALPIGLRDLILTN